MASAFILARSSRSPLKKLQARLIPPAAICNGDRPPPPTAGARNWLFELLCVRAVGDEARQMLTQARTQARCGEPSPWFSSREGAPLCWKPTDMRLRPACFPTGGLLGPLLRSIAIALIADCWRRFRMCPPPRGEIPSCGQLIDPAASY
jgi:hypothetical protein